MHSSSGRWLPLSSPRQWMGDLVHFGQQIPSRTIERRMRLASLVAARRAAWPRPGWCAVFLKAYALIAARRPTLRQIYRPLPWPHLYQHPQNVASVPIARPFGDEDAVFFAMLHSPENLGLMEIDTEVHRCQEQPLEASAAFRRQRWLMQLPGAVRRPFLQLALHGPGGWIANYLGTFAVNTLGSRGASEISGPSLWSTSLTYGVLGDDGTFDVRLTYDPRVRDAAMMAAALTDLEDVLSAEIIRELGYLQALEAA
jgi:hypothetical protein